jgi:hypothetical protein
LGARIESLKDVAEALFAEWEDELDEYESRELRASSERRLHETRRRYERMMSAMTRAHRKVEPVLVTFRDVVLAMKHALNAEAIAGLRGELDDVEREVDALVAAMNDSIAQAGAFLNTLDESATGNTGARSAATRSQAAFCAASVRSRAYPRNRSASRELADAEIGIAYAAVVSNRRKMWFGVPLTLITPLHRVSPLQNGVVTEIPRSVSRRS